MKYILVNDQNQVFAGFEFGNLKWSSDWDDAREVSEKQTTVIRRYNKFEMLSV